MRNMKELKKDFFNLGISLGNHNGVITLHLHAKAERANSFSKRGV